MSEQLVQVTVLESHDEKHIKFDVQDILSNKTISLIVEAEDYLGEMSLAKDTLELLVGFVETILHKSEYNYKIGNVKISSSTGTDVNKLREFLAEQLESVAPEDQDDVLEELAQQLTKGMVDKIDAEIKVVEEDLDRLLSNPFQQTLAKVVNDLKRKQDDTDDEDPKKPKGPILL